MDGVKQQIRARQAEALNNKHVFETRKIKREMRSEIDKITDKNERTLKTIRKDYDKEALAEKNKLETKLLSLRKKNKETLKNEEKRFEKMIEELKVTHNQKMTEVKISQEKEAEKKIEEHQTYLETAREKFQAEQAKLEA